MRSILHAAETQAEGGHPHEALAWFLAAGVRPPHDWLLNIATTWPRLVSAEWEYLGHAVRYAAAEGDTEMLSEIARSAASRNPLQMAELRMAAFAARAADGAAEVMRDAVRDAERHMCTVRINLAGMHLPTAADFDAPPPELPPIAPPERMNDLIDQGSFERGATAFELLAAAGCAYPLIYRGSACLRNALRTVFCESQPLTALAWRYFEAAEHLRDLGVARDT